MPSHVRGACCRPSANRSCRWIAVLTMVAMLGFSKFALAATGTNQETTLFAPPSNDACAGAIVIPSATLPVVSAAVNITDATPQDVDEGILACATTDRTIWFSFTPTVSATYVISTCNGASGSTVYDTVLGVFASTGGACPQAASVGCNDTDSGCVANLPGSPYLDQSTVVAELTAGTTYFIVAGHWSQDTGGVTPGFENIAVQIHVSPAPTNDTCSHPTALTLNQVTPGTTADAANDYRSVGDSTCFSGIGQTPTTSAGRDVVFSFSTPADGKYSFRYVQDDLTGALHSQNPSLYLSDSCPGPAPGGPAVPCIKGANRITTDTIANRNLSEEINCVTLTAGQQVYLYFDDRVAGNLGGPFGIEVTTCAEETEPNDSIATANPYAGCGMRGAANTAADVDVYSLGSAPAGSKVFVSVDGAAANDTDFELRITNATDTLGYDDNDGTPWTGPDSPVVGGVIADGSPLFARVNKGSAGAQLVASEPYRLYARVETSQAQEEVDSPSNGDYYHANVVTGGGFVKGVMATPDDRDCFRFVANKGDEIVVFTDNNPSRAGGTIPALWPILKDLVFAPPANQVFIGQVLRNIVTPSPGTLTGVTPSVTSEWYPYRARYAGTYMVCFAATSPAQPSAYPLPYQGSISLNCGPIPAPVSRIADVSISKQGPAGPIGGGDGVEFAYTITLTNDGNDIAQDVRLVDTLPSNLTFQSLVVDDGFQGNNTGCISLPTVGTTDAAIDCTNYSLAPGASTTFTLTVKTVNCIGAGVNVVNTASITTLTTDPDLTDNAATYTFQTTSGNSCDDGNPCTDDLACNPVLGCVHTNNSAPCSDGNACTENDTCGGGTCNAGAPKVCNDGDTCTQDSCIAQIGCSYIPLPFGSPCNDGSACTTNDRCLSLNFGDECFGGGCTVALVCIGGPALDCNDNNPCTTNACIPATGCDNSPTPNVSCNDGNACTSNDACTAAGTCVGHDATGPSITSTTANPAFLWPPNHTMRSVTVNAVAYDGCGGGVSCQVTQVASNEPENGTGDGDTAHDWSIVDATHVQLRAERAGTGTGRIYTITVTCADASGNSTTSTTTVQVRHDISSPKSGAAFRIGSNVNFAGSFLDVLGRTHTGQWLFDSLSAPGIISEPTATRPGSVTGSYTFTAAGVYAVKMNVTDRNGVTGTADGVDGVNDLVVIYDPNGGYVTGGGWVNSPAGALKSNPTQTGKVNFGFVSKYFRNATNPKGETEFGFRLANFKFSALNFDYLVISGARAQYKGAGKVNGSGSYQFILTVIDGQAVGGGGVDKFRIKIWNKTTGAIVYDNQMGAPDNADPTTPVGSGSSIVIQSL